MKATKIIMTIKLEVLSIDSIAALLGTVIERIDSEFTSGTLAASDGDFVEWITKQQPVEF